MPEEAKKRLSDVNPDSTFKMNTGEEVRGLIGLLRTLKEISPETFGHHVDEYKNDFSNWIKNSVGDFELAERLTSCKKLDETIDVIGDRIIFLQNKVEMGEIVKKIDTETKTNNNKPIIEAKKEHAADLKSMLYKTYKVPRKTNNIHPIEAVKHSMKGIVIGLIIGGTIGFSIAYFLL